jgi:hypothetical protein
MNAQELMELDADSLAAMATEPQASDHTVVMPGRILAPQDQPQAIEVPVLAEPRKPRGRTSGGRGAPLKDDPNNPDHLWAISGRKGPNGQGTVIFVLSHGVWFEVPRTKAKDAFAQIQGRCNATVYTDDNGQRMLLIG